MALSDAVSGRDAALQGQRHRDAGDAERMGRARAPRRHPGELPRQRRRRHRHVSSPRSSARRSCSRGPTRGRRSRTARWSTVDLVTRIKALGAVPAMFTTYAYYNPDKFVYYGEELMKRCMAYRSLLDAGVYACAGSDFSPGPFAPLMGIQGMVTRKGWDGKTWGANQTISVSEAIAVNTYNGAWASAARRRSRDRSPPASWPTTWCWPTTRTRWTSRRSRTSRSCARSSAGACRIRRRRGQHARSSRPYPLNLQDLGPLVVGALEGRQIGGVAAIHRGHAVGVGDGQRAGQGLAGGVGDRHPV